MKNALIIFVRNPVLGKVKTRLAKVIGEKEALRIYKELLSHTHAISLNAGADKYVFYSDYLQLGDLWGDAIYHKFLQIGETLGDKMKQAFSRLFDNGYENVIIIGSDCYELTTPLIETAFEKLSVTDTVIGPAKDGGFYLLGLKKMIPQIFENKKWSTSTVCNKIIQDFIATGHTFSMLPLLSDVDMIKDVPPSLL